MRSVLRRQRCIARYKKLYGLVFVDEAFKTSDSPRKGCAKSKRPRSGT